MTNPSDKPRVSRTKRREEMLSLISRLTGCLAIVTTVAVVFYVVIERLERSPPVDPAYTDVIETMRSHQWQSSTQPPTSPLGVARPKMAPDTTLHETETKLSDIMPLPNRGIVDLDQKRPLVELAVRQFFEAENLEQKLAVARDPQRVRSLMEIYYQNRPPEKAAWQRLAWVVPVDEPGLRLAYAQAEFKGSDPVSIIVEEAEDGQFRVDWESSVRYCEQTWQEFQSLRPGDPTLFRVLGSKLTSDDRSIPTGHAVIELKHPTEKGTLQAYFSPTDPQFKSLVEQLELGNWKNVPLTLRLCYPGPTSDTRSVRITGVEGKGWLILPNRRS